MQLLLFTMQLLLTNVVLVLFLSGTPSLAQQEVPCPANITQSCSGQGTCVAVITDTGSTFSCKCIQGYEGTGLTCTDIDECTRGTHNCSPNANCANIVGSFTCTCKPGFEGNGVNCTDIDECTRGTHNCSPNANCANIVGSFTCTCKPGFEGNGVNCTDIDECTRGTHNCSPNANCANIVGSFTCTCKPGFEGNGVNCTDVNECTKGTHNCDVNAECNNTEGSFTCKCKDGYVGNGVTCTAATEPCNSQKTDLCNAYDTYKVKPGTGCKNFCQCAPLTTKADGTILYYWQKMTCPTGTLWDVSITNCNHAVVVTCTA